MLRTSLTKPREADDRLEGADREDRGCSAGGSGLAEKNQLAEQAAIENDSLCEGIDHSCSLPQARLEELCISYFRNFRGLVESTCGQRLSRRMRMT